ncbi:MAG: hypothetical protein NT077_02575 [Candidatus Taylorbacteria bacterium]|nr:hypothetical protein [Candidatus Taylorbacteria bacterium]
MKKLIVSLAVALMPVVAFAQVIGNPVRDVNSLAYKLTGIGNTIIVILIAVAVIYLVYNILMFIVKAGSEDRKTYQSGVLWGIVGLAVILSIWGLVAILTNTFGTSGSQGPTQQYPQNLPPPVVQ